MNAVASHECSECTSVANKESIFVAREQRKKAARKPICIGKFTMPGWSGLSRFYLFKCYCDAIVVDYPHGYTSGGHIYFSCEECEASLVILDRDIYNKEGIAMPPGFFKTLWGILKLRFNLNRKIGVNHN